MYDLMSALDNEIKMNSAHWNKLTRINRVQDTISVDNCLQSAQGRFMKCIS